MMRSIKLAALCCLGLLTHTAQATDITIDFEDFTAFTLASPGFQTRGFEFTLDSGGSIHNHRTWDLGLNTSGNDGQATLTLREQSNRLFSLHSFDLYELLIFNNESSTDIQLLVTGHQIGGAQVTRSLGHSDALTNILLAGFDNLQSVDFHLTGAYLPSAPTGAYFPVVHLDNFAVSTVPTPAALWLLLAGLGLLRHVRR